MAVAQPDFSFSRPVNPYTGITTALGNIQTGLNNTLDMYQKDDILKQQQAQQDIENKRADTQLAIQQTQAQRLQDEYNRKVAGDQALKKYNQQLGAYQSDVVTPQEADKIRQVYDANPNVDVQSLVNAAQDRYNATSGKDAEIGAKERLNMLNTLAMPDKQQYDPTRLYNAKETALAKPQGLLDTIAAQKVKDAEQQQAQTDRMKLALYKQNLKNASNTGSKGSYKTYYNLKTGDAIPIKSGDQIPKGFVEASVYNANSKHNGSGHSKSKNMSFTEDEKTNGRLSKELSDTANIYGIDNNTIQQALNDAKGDQNNFLWWRDIGSSLGLDTEPSKHDVLSKISSGYVNSTGKTVSIADQEGYLKKAGVTIFKDMNTGKYVNKDAVTGKVLSQADVQKRISSLPNNTPTNNVVPDNNTTTTTTNSNAQEPVDKNKEELIKYINALKDPNSKEFKDEINNTINMVAGGGVRKVAQPVIDSVSLKASQGLDKLFGKTTIPGQGFFKNGTEKIAGGSAKAAKQEFLKSISDETAVLLAKPAKSPQDIARLKEIANKFPKFKKGIMEHLYK